MDNVTIKPSKIQGLGVFAARDFKKKEIVMKWDTSICLSKKEAENVPKRYRKYLVYNKGRYIFSQSPERYLNHSCSPNTMEKDCSDVALKQIKKGEELTTDYSIDAPPHIKMRCNCGSIRCKKII